MQARTRSRSYFAVCADGEAGVGDALITGGSGSGKSTLLRAIREGVALWRYVRGCGWWAAFGVFALPGNLPVVDCSAGIAR